MFDVRHNLNKLWHRMMCSEKDAIRKELEFLPAAIEVLETPPPPAARWMMWSLMLFFVVALLWSIIGHMDVVVVGQGRVQPTSKVKVIQALETSEVKDILVKDGQFVKEGEWLIELDPTAPESDRQQLESDIAFNSLRRYRLNYSIAVVSGESQRHEFSTHLRERSKGLEAVDDSMLSLHESVFSDQMEGYFSQSQKLQSEVTRREKSLALADSRMEGLKKLAALSEQTYIAAKERYAIGSISVAEWMQAKSDYTSSNAEYISSVDSVAEAQSDLQVAEGEKHQYQRSFIEQLASSVEEVDKEIRSLTIALKKAKDREDSRYIRSPVDGYVSQLKYHTVGGVVTPADPLMHVVPVGSQLQVEANILNKDIGFIHIGQSVQIKVDSFSYTKYGYLEGEVINIGADAILDENAGYYYPVIVELKTNEILVKDKYIPVISGMTVVADIKVGTRRVIDYFLTNFLEYQSEAMRER